MGEIKILGIQLDYEISPGMTSRFNQKMFGRISSRYSNGKRYSYYIPGVLDELQYHRIIRGRIFICAEDKIDFNSVMKYVNKFQISSVAKDDNEILMRTGRQRWRTHVRERGIEIDNI